MDEPTERYSELLMRSQEAIQRMDSFAATAPEVLQEYVETLNNPWSHACKLPHGFPVKSNLAQLIYRFPVRSSGTTLTINTTAITLASAGSDFIVEFKPLAFDQSALCRLSANATTPSVTLFNTWTSNFITTKGVSTYYDAFRLVSGGIRFTYGGRDDATAGYIYHGFSNSSAGNLTAEFMADPETDLHAIKKGKWYGERYMPMDSRALEFKPIAVASAPDDFVDWRGFIMFSGYSSTDFAGIIEVSCNYECIPKVQFEMITNPTLNYGGDALPAIQKKQKESNKKQEKTSNFVEDVYDAFKSTTPMGLLLP